MKKNNKPFLAWKVVDCREGILRSGLHPIMGKRTVVYEVGKFVKANPGENPFLFCFKTLRQAQAYGPDIHGLKIFRCLCKGRIKDPWFDAEWDVPEGTVTARYVKLLKEVKR